MNEIDVKKIISSMKEVQLGYTYAKSRGNGVEAARQKMMNVLFNDFNDILCLLEEYGSLKEEITSLDNALRDADEEIKKLKAQAKKKATQE